MHLLIDPLPKTITIEDKAYNINYGYKEMLLFEELMLDDSLETGIKLQQGLNLFYKEPIPAEHLFTAIDKLLWFRALGEEEKERDRQSKEQKGISDDKPLISFREDAMYLYAAYKSQYNVDIYDDNIHWWKFISMFRGLTEEHEISKIITYRGIKITKDMTPEQKRFYKRMKRIYKLPDNRSQEEIDSITGEIFASVL